MSPIGGRPVRFAPGPPSAVRAWSPEHGAAQHARGVGRKARASRRHSPAPDGAHLVTRPARVLIGGHVQQPPRTAHQPRGQRGASQARTARRRGAPLRRPRRQAAMRRRRRGPHQRGEHRGRVLVRLAAAAAPPATACVRLRLAREGRHARGVATARPVRARRARRRSRGAHRRAPRDRTPRRHRSRRASRRARGALAALERLHPRRREMLLLQVAGFSATEIAAGNDIAPARARELIYKARLQLANRMRD